MNDETPIEAPEEELPPEPEKKEPFATVWDVVTVIALALVAGAFWLWYSSAKHESSSHFGRADSLYVAGDYPAALGAYRELRNSEAIIASKDDSLLYRRMDSLEEFESSDQQLAQAARAALVSEDTALIRSAFDVVTGRTHGFVPAALIDSLKR